MAKRFQLSRQRGSRKPDGGVGCARPSRFSNPYRLQDYTFANADGSPKPWDEKAAREMALRDFNHALAVGMLRFTVEDVRRELAGKPLGCFCPLDEQLCHVETLLRVAAGGEP